MTKATGIENQKGKGASTQLLAALGLTPGDVIELPNSGVFVTVRKVELHAHGRTMRMRKMPRCRITCTVRSENGGSVDRQITAEQDDVFVKLVGEDQ